MELEKRLAHDRVEIRLDNFFLFTPMLPEVAASDLDLTTTVNPVRKLLRRVQFFAGEVEHIDTEQKKVVVSHGFDHHQHPFEFDYLVLGLGSVTNLNGIPGLQEYAPTMKTLGDAARLRNHLIAHLEEADTECCKEKGPLLTFVCCLGRRLCSSGDSLGDQRLCARSAAFVRQSERKDVARRSGALRTGDPAGVRGTVGFLCTSKTVGAKSGNPSEH
jgi:hypothetical protein